MARLNEQHVPGAAAGLPDSVAVEVLKKRFIRQNREIARSNSAQATRIRTLETENTQLLSENISLREQVILLQSRLDERDQQQQIVDNVAVTQKALQRKVDEVNDLVKGLGLTITLPQKPRRLPSGSKFRKYPLRTELPKDEPRAVLQAVVVTDVPEGCLQPIVEKSERSRCSSASSEERERELRRNEEKRRKSGILLEDQESAPNSDDVVLAPPDAYDSDDDDIKPPVSSMLDLRLRKRRESGMIGVKMDDFADKTFVLDDPEDVPRVLQPPPKFNLSRPPKRKLALEPTDVMESTSPVEPTPKRDFSDVSRRAALAAMKELEAEDRENRRILIPLDFPSEDLVFEDALQEPVPEPVKSSTPVEHLGENLVTLKEPSAAAKARKALGAKSTNSEATVSPVKIAAAAAAAADPRSENPMPLSTVKLDSKVEKLDASINTDLPPAPSKLRLPSCRDKDTPPPESVATTANARPSRRTRGAQVSYAEPNLRAKMRREEASLVDAVTGEGKTRRSVSGGNPSKAGTKRKGSSSEPAEIKIKIEEDEQPRTWLNIPPAPTEEKNIKQTDEKKEGTVHPSLLPTSIMRDKERRDRRRTTGIVTPLLKAADIPDDMNGQKASLSGTIDKKRRARSFGNIAGGVVGDASAAIDDVVLKEKERERNLAAAINERKAASVGRRKSMML